MDQQTITLILAIWGAVVATGVGVWDVIKWKRSGARLRIYANGRMASTDPLDNKIYLFVRVENVGDAPTTLKLLTYRFFKEKPSIIFRTKPTEMGFFNTLHTSPSVLPHKLDPGTEWTHVLPLAPEVEKKAQEGYFYVVIEDTMTSSGYKFPSSRMIVGNTETGS